MEQFKKSAQELWNDLFSQLNPESVKYNLSWLDEYKTLLNKKKVQNVLEIGCGSGNDTNYLVNEGFVITATDFSEAAISLVKERFPNIEVLQHDTINPFPFRDNSFDLVVASLSLHYFNESTTKQIIEEIKRMLKVNGLLLFRLNSTNDDDAKKEHPIERYFYSIQSCRQLFVNWREIVLKEHLVNYYGKPKVLIEGVYEKS